MDGSLVAGSCNDRLPTAIGSSVCGRIERFCREFHYLRYLKYICLSCDLEKSPADSVKVRGPSIVHLHLRINHHQK